MTREEVTDLVRYENLERLPEEAKGILALVGHTGNWELMATSTAFLEHPVPLNIVVKPIKPESLNRWINNVRSQWGNSIHLRKGSSKNLIKLMKQGENLGFILDQNARRKWGIFVDFFGKPACTHHALAQLAALSGHRIFPVLCRRDLDTRKLIVSIGEEVPGPANRSEEEVHRVTQECTKRLEDFIRTYPDQWIWMHRRWNTKQL
jgi:KDO2-lipid IV(A) lauroyltransferase